MKLSDLISVAEFFAKQEMYEYAELMNKWIEIKTLIYVEKLLKINNYER